MTPTRRRYKDLNSCGSFPPHIPIMQLLALVLAAASVALATVPTLSSYSAAGCPGTPLATWSGVAENAFCEATAGAIALNITPGASDKNCEIDLYTTCA
ncbi:hypothetical protein C8F04DRAFT_1122068, partial [Mycena alexandri]